MHRKMRLPSVNFTFALKPKLGLILGWIKRNSFRATPGNWKYLAARAKSLISPDPDEGKTNPKERFGSKNNIYQEVPVISTKLASNFVPAVASRLKNVLEIINEYSSNGTHITPEKVTQLLGLHSTVDVEICFSGRAEPTKEFLDLFADLFNVNKDWLHFGQSFPFKSQEIYKPNPLDYFRRMQEIKPETVYFVRENAGVFRTAILVQTGQRFFLFPNTPHISRHVGKNGERSMRQFYELIKAFQKVDQNHALIGIQISEQNYQQLVEGVIYPGNIRYLGVQDNWPNDFVDLNSQVAIDEYSRLYDEDFAIAQKIVLRNLSEII